MKARILVTFFFVTLFISNCSSRETAKREEIFTTPVLKSWSQLFEKGEEIAFSFNGAGKRLRSISAIQINSKGEYLLLDGKAARLLHFDPSGRFIRCISKRGMGRGEFLIAGCLKISDKTDGLYLFDFGKMDILKYSAPGYWYQSRLALNYPIQDMIVCKNYYLLYTLQEDSVLIKIDKNGNKAVARFNVKDENLRKFMSRFQLGRLCDFAGNGFLYMPADKYTFYLLDYNFNTLKILGTKETSLYFPSLGKFPRNLSPYEFTPKHSRWWGKNLHPAFMHRLNNEIFMVVLFKYNNLSTKSYINVHDLYGHSLALGLEVPGNGIIRLAKNGYIYVVENPKFGNNGTILPCRLIRYPVKIPPIRRN